MNAKTGKSTRKAKTTDGMTPIAVVGLGALYPGSGGRDGLWRDIVEGRDNISDVPESYWLVDDHYDPDPQAPDKTYARRGGFIDRVAFDPMEFGIPPNAIPATDTVQLLALIVAKKVLEEAAENRFESVDRSRTSIILGVASATELVVQMGARLQRPVWVKAMRDAGLPEGEVQAVADRIADEYTPWQENSFPGMLGNVVAGRIANRLDLGGSNYVTDAACASSLSALQAGIHELQLGHSDLVISGGVDALNDILMFMCFSKTPAFSPTEDVRPFSDKADGTMLGEGIGMVALRRLEDAERDGNLIYGVIRGVGSASDGKSMSVYAPRPEGQSSALERAYAQAGYGPETVELIEAHGTGTMAGDAAEVQGLKNTFEAADQTRKQWCALGTIKSQIGHTKAAAGAAGLAKILLSLHHKTLPPTIKVDRPNPKLGLEDSPFYLNTQTRPWIRGADHPRRASVSSFGFGGSNFHVTVEEYRGTAPRPKRTRTLPGELVLLSAADKTGLAQTCRDISDQGFDRNDLAIFARQSQRDFDPNAPERVTLVVVSSQDLSLKLRIAADALEKGAPVMAPQLYHQSGTPERGKTAFLFSGQGSQYPGMGADLAMAFDEALSVWDSYADLKTKDQTPLHNAVFPPPAFDTDSAAAHAATLTQTATAQPAMALVGLSQLAVLKRLGRSADSVAGHSFGEVLALHAGGVLTDDQAVSVAHQRGALMGQAADTTAGAMMSVGMDGASAEQWLQENHIDLSIANDNGPDQVVLTGAVDQIDRAEKALKASDIRATRLPVQTAFHSPIVQRAVKPFEAFLKELSIAKPQVPIIANTTASEYPSAKAKISQLLASQIAKPVRFRDCIDRLYDQGVRTFVEVGPGSVLTGLVDRCLDGRPHLAVPLDRKGANGIISLLDAMARLAVAGHELDHSLLWDGFEPVVETETPPSHALQINGSNYGKPYPPTGGTSALPLPNPERPMTMTHDDPKNPTPGPAAQHPTPDPITPQSNTGGDQWLAALDTFQRNLTDAHRHFQTTMAESHQAYLATVQAALTGASPDPQSHHTAVTLPDAPLPTSMPAPPEPPTPVPPPQTPIQTMAPPPNMSAAPSPAVATYDTGEEHSSAPATVVPPASTSDVKTTLLDVVSEKTGYPVEMLALDMELEAGLGIDSIKQVEILSALRDRMPDLPEIDPAMLGELKTLGQIIDYIGKTAPTSAAPSAPSAASSAPSPASHGQSEDVASTLLDIVADKTGYPVEMLAMDAELEAGLGVDSIKQVEILSALRERMPDLPEIDPSMLGELKTLGQIVDRLGRAVPATAPVPAATAAPVAAGTGPSSASGPEVQPVLLEIVADKTGYPAEMLALDAELEAGLGIDSIKQVEILSALRDRLPSLPEIDPAMLGELKTLGQIVEYLKAEGTTGSPCQQSGDRAPQDAGPSKQEQSGQTIDRLVPKIIDAPAAGLSMKGFWHAQSIAVLPSECRFAKALADQLKQAGLPVTAWDPKNPASAVVHMGGVKVKDPKDLYWDAIEVARETARRHSEHGFLFVTVQDTGGAFGFEGPVAAGSDLNGLPAIAKTVRLEYPSATVKSIDIAVGRQSSKTVAERLFDELTVGGPEMEVGLGPKGARVTIQTESVPLSSTDFCLEDGDTVVVSGGARSVTAATVKRLARERRLNFLLLGRSSITDEPAFCSDAADMPALMRALAAAAPDTKPDVLRAQAQRILNGREAIATLNAIKDAGSQVDYHSTDITDVGAVAAAITVARDKFGPVKAIIHGAGINLDKSIADKTRDQLDIVYSTKVQGLNALLSATRDDPLKAILLFSSIAGRYGNSGQCDYAIANDVLNKMAQDEARQRKGTCLVKSINWGPWDGGMVDANLKRMFEEKGVSVIPLAEGAEFMVRELSDKPDGPIEVVAAGGDGLQQSEWTMTAMVDGAQHPFIADHVVKGSPVLPMVLVIEWFMRLGNAIFPDLRPDALENIHVRNGVVLDRYPEPECFDIVARPVRTNGSARMGLELVSRDGKVRYTAEMTLSHADQPQAAPAIPSRLSEGAPWPHSEAESYNGRLFHGPGFQVIRKFGRNADEGASGTIDGTVEKGWPGGPWLTDPAAMDGGMQLGFLWGMARTGQFYLPLRVASFRPHRLGAVAGELTCTVGIQQNGGRGTLNDILLTTSDGDPLFEMNGVELYGLDHEPDGTGDA